MLSLQWQARRREKLQRYPMCEICYIRPSIQCHHWTYATIGNERDEDLCAVCLICHHKLHYVAPANDNWKQLSLGLPDPILNTAQKSKKMGSG